MGGGTTRVTNMAATILHGRGVRTTGATTGIRISVLSVRNGEATARTLEMPLAMKRAIAMAMAIAKAMETVTEMAMAIAATGMIT